MDFPSGSAVKNLPVMQETWVQSLGRKDLEEEGMATHSILAWRIPCTEEPGRLQSTGSQSWTCLKQRAHSFSIKSKLLFPISMVMSHLSVEILAAWPFGNSRIAWDQVIFPPTGNCILFLDGWLYKLSFTKTFSVSSR